MALALQIFMTLYAYDACRLEQSVGPKLSHHVPDASDIVAVDVATRAVFGVGIQRIAIIRPLALAIGTAYQRHSPIILGRGRRGAGAPLNRSLAITMRFAGLILIECIHSHATRRGHHRTDRGAGHVAGA